MSVQDFVSEQISLFIVDDEIHNIKLLEYYVTRNFNNIKIVGSSTSKEDAIKKIKILKPKLLFLDVILDSGTGFNLLDDLGEDFNIKVVFVTAYSEYAIKAFKYSAIDYILKPIELKNLERAIEKSSEDVYNKVYFNKYQNSFASEFHEKKITKSKVLFVHSQLKIEVIIIEEILFLKSDGRYTSIHLINGKKIVAVKSIKEFEINS